MKQNFILIFPVLILGLYLNQVVFAQTTTTTTSNQVCTKVGTTDKPSPCIGGVCTKTPSVPGDYRQSLINDFGIMLDSRFDAQHTQWAWENFCTVANTRFNDLVKGTTVIFSGDGGSAQTDCKTIELGSYTREVFRVVLFHELGHIVRNCSNRADSHYSEHLQALQNEGAVTTYPDQLCTYTAREIAKMGRDFLRQSEDYAEMITYYLNPNSSSQTTKECSVGGNPYTGGQKSMHFGVARSILGAYP